MNISLFQDLCDLCGKDERMPGRVEPRGVQREANALCLTSGVDAKVQVNSVCMVAINSRTHGVAL